jgi:hypothetical protein
VRLTPRLQLRRNLVDRSREHLAPRARDPRGSHLGRRFRRSARLTRPLLPLRVACRWTNPSRSDLPSRQDWPAPPTRQWDDATTNPKRLPSSNSTNLIPKNRAETRIPASLATRTNPPSFIHRPVAPVRVAQ